MNNNSIRRIGASAALLLAAAAYAQPTVTEDFGTLVLNTPVVRTVNIAPAQVLWYKLTLPNAVPAGGTDFLDIRTHSGGGTITDTELGLYDAMAESGPVTSEELARRTGTYERYVREWLLNQAAGGYVEYDPTSGRYSLPPEHAGLLPVVFAGFQTYLAAARAESRMPAC